MPQSIRVDPIGWPGPERMMEVEDQIIRRHRESMLDGPGNPLRQERMNTGDKANLGQRPHRPSGIGRTDKNVEVAVVTSRGLVVELLCIDRPLHEDELDPA